MSSNYELVSFIDCRDIYNTPELLSFDWLIAITSTEPLE
jgi:hypothetical protein